MKIIKTSLIAAVGLYALACLALFAFQRDLMFGASTVRISPSQVGVAQADEVVLTTSSGLELYSWYSKAQTGQPTVLYLHGNGGSIGTRADLHHRFAEHGYGLFMAGYPGYGGSGGKPSEPGLNAAAALAYQHSLDSSVRPQDIILFGESLGTSVATQLATRVSARALVLVSPMYSIREIAKQQYPYFPIHSLLKDPFLTFEHIAQIQMPVLVVHGSADSAIPVTSGQRLFDLAKQPKTYRLIEGAGHNDMFDFGLLDVVADYVEVLSQP